MKRIIAISCLAAVVLTGCGLIGQKEGKDKSETTTAATEASTTAAEETTTEAETVVEAVTPEIVTAPAVTTTEPDGNVSAGGLMDMYPAIYQGVIKTVFEETAAEHGGIASIEFAFRDLDADGIPELLLKYGTCEADFQIHLYKINPENGADDLGLIGGGHTSFAYDENTGDFVIVWGHMGAASINYFKWDNGNLKSTGSYDFTIDENTPSYEKVLEEKGIRYMDVVYATRYEDGSVKSYFSHPNGETEEFDELYLDYMG